jgi:lactase-phlorizin hydrolase
MTAFWEYRHLFLFQLGMFAHNIFRSSGEYPPQVEARVNNNSRAEGYIPSRLPTFTQEEVDFIRGQRSGYKSK